MTDPSGAAAETDRPSKRSEFVAFLLLAFGVWPFVAIGVVGGYGLLVWMFQLAYGPPGTGG